MEFSIFLAVVIVATFIYLRREIFLLQSELDSQVSYYDEVISSIRTDIIKFELGQLASQYKKKRNVTKKLGRPANPNSARQKKLKKANGN